ncbi:hypothetical protein DPMN_040465 [Dreissena polymorpha]|uniref:Uncharacterized protein n=1 Tax=Dreissena polymorpha TaxID=45954 RepID=A0A9D4CV38_DREPO|nr:hypothetical protein DPMN_040465 [Dreissena polymorpha]
MYYQIPESVHNGSLADVVDYLCDGLDDDLDRLQMIAAWLVHRQLKSENVDTSRRFDRELCCQTMHKMCKYDKIVFI